RHRPSLAARSSGVAKSATDHLRVVAETFGQPPRTPCEAGLMRVPRRRPRPQCQPPKVLLAVDLADSPMRVYRLRCVMACPPQQPHQHARVAEQLLETDHQLCPP